MRAGDYFARLVDPPPTPLPLFLSPLYWGKGSGNVFGERLLDRPDPSLLVHGGTSGIGTTAIQLAREFGVDVHATAGSQDKVRVCETLGAVGYNYREDAAPAGAAASWDLAVMERGGVDLVLDMVCGDYMARNREEPHVPRARLAPRTAVRRRCCAFKQRLPLPRCLVRLRAPSEGTLNARAGHRHRVYTASVLALRPRM